jgi:hypothetical protein
MGKEQKSLVCDIKDQATHCIKDIKSLPKNHTAPILPSEANLQMHCCEGTNR